MPHGVRLFEHRYRQDKVHVDGTHRARTPDETLTAYEPLCASIGITRLANVTGLDSVGIPVYQSVRPNARSLTVQQGKGFTRAAAKASALMESIESWHAETMAVSSRYETIGLLASRETITDLDRLPRASGRALTEDTVLAWVEGFDIARERRVWAPYEMVDLNHTQVAPAPELFPSDSNGLASGNHVLEAISHGLCEVIERDAHALWVFDASDPLGIASLVRLDSVTDPGCRRLLDSFRRAGCTVAVQDITSDTGVPCYQCLVVEAPESPRPIGQAWGHGCHPSPAVALSRALTEAAQTRVTFIAGARDDFSYIDYDLVSNEAQRTAIIRVLADNPPRIDFGDRASLATPTFEGDIAEILSRLRRVGIDSAIVVDLTRDDVGVPVVKVIVPGLEAAVRDPRRHVAGERLRRKVMVEAAA